MTAPPDTGAARAIRARLAAVGRIPFREFMERALYEPGGGVYTRAGATTGRAGDFSTSSDVSPDFGRRLALQLAEIADRQAGPWRLAELGPGRGLLAADILDGLAAFAPAARERLAGMVLVERSPALAALQRERLVRAAPDVACEWVERLEDARSGAPFVIVANEVLDALPVHAITRAGDGLHELWVVAGDDGALAFEPGPVTDPRIEDIAARYGLSAEPGWRAEVSLAMEELMCSIARLPVLGALFLDYGHRARELAAADHADGTLMGYREHRLVADVLEAPGLVDITAHVNWDHAADAARLAGFDVAGPVPQDRFLLALGLMDDLARQDAAPGPESRDALVRRLAARALVLPGAGGGRRFQALAIVRERAPELRGFRPLQPPSR